MKKIAYLAVGLLCLSMSLAQELTKDNDNRKAGDTLELTIKDVKYTFHWCPAGTFQMGSPLDEAGRRKNEGQYTVILSRGFWMLETEVTQGMWTSVMEDNPSSFKGIKLPVESVSWNDCQVYIGKLNELKVAPTDFKFSLPTEAQWEYACRAGTVTVYHFGNILDKKQANYGGGVGKTTKAGSYSANAWGLRDMHGNVWEWCLDRYGDYPGSAVTDPTGAAEGLPRVIRGGSWNSHAEYCRSANRDNNIPLGRFPLIGLRLALVSAPPPPAPVRALRLDNTETNDADLEKICRDNPELVELTLGNTKITDAGLAHLIQLKKLRKVRISKTAITDAGMTNLAKCETLEDIDVSQTKIGSIGMGELRTLPRLKSLNLYLTLVTDAGLASLGDGNYRSAAKIERLNLDKCPITDAGIAKLSSLTNLAWIHLGGTAITDVGLVELAKFNSLKEAVVTKTETTLEGIEKLRQARPDMTVRDNVSEKTPQADIDEAANYRKQLAPLREKGRTHLQSLNVD